MTEETDRLRRHALALAAANHQLAARIDTSERSRRAQLGRQWAAAPAGADDLSGVRLARFPDGVISLLEGGQRRPVRSGLLVAALERILGPWTILDEDEAGGWEDGPPVEVLEGPTGPPYLVVAGHRLPLRGLPLTHPVDDDGTERPAGPELDLSQLLVEQVGEPPADEPDPSVGPLPTFLIIGAQKSATRWLRTNLDVHPEIFTAPGEPGFFNDEDRWKREGLNHYRAHFEGWDGEPHIGESTPGYLMWTQRPEIVAERIHRALPDVRLIALLRNPIDRARSALMHHILKKRLAPDTDLMAMVRMVPPEQDQLGLITGGWYAASLAPYVELFGDALLVLLHDDVLADPARAYTRVLAHLDATPLLPPNLGRFRESQETLLPDTRPLTPEDRRELWEYFRDDVAQLEVMLDRDLSAWDPARAPG